MGRQDESPKLALLVERIGIDALLARQLANVLAGDFLEKSRFEPGRREPIGIVALEKDIGRVKVAQLKDCLDAGHRWSEAVVGPIVAIYVIDRTRVVIVDGKGTYGNGSLGVPAKLGFCVIVAKENLLYIV